MKSHQVRKGGPIVDATEFRDLHKRCITVMRGYFAEAEKTSLLLANCSSEPLPFLKRFEILRQEVVENDAHRLYLDAKGLLHRTALVGYEHA